jgi:hypothetical protein
MCLSCGCGKPNDKHGDNRNITLDDLNRAAEAAGTTRDRVLQNIMTGTNAEQASSSSSQPSASSSNGQTQPNYNGQESNSFLPADQPRPQPGEYRENPGQESGTDWQESQQMGRTGRGGVQKPQEE